MLVIVSAGSIDIGGSVLEGDKGLADLTRLVTEVELPLNIST
jgi:hypothetical protein